MPTINPPTHQHLKRFYLISTIISMVCFVWLGLIPREGGDDFIFGYSKARIILLLIIFLISAFSIFLFGIFHIETPTGLRISKYLQARFSDINAVRRIRAITLIGWGIGSFLLITAVLTNDQYLKGILLRLAPLITLGTLAAIQLNNYSIRIFRKPSIPERYSQQIFIISLIWFLLGLIWIFTTA